MERAFSVEQLSELLEAGWSDEQIDEYFGISPEKCFFCQIAGLCCECGAVLPGHQWCEGRSGAES